MTADDVAKDIVDAAIKVHRACRVRHVFRRTTRDDLVR